MRARLMAVATILLIGAGPESPTADDDLFSTYRRPVVKDSLGNVIPSSRFEDYPECFFRWQQQGVDRDGTFPKLKISTFQFKSLISSEQFRVDPTWTSYAVDSSVLGTRGILNLYHLDEKKQRAFHSLLAKLPPSTIGPPLDQLICISYNDTSKVSQWITRTYDLRKLPEEAEQLLEISGFNKVTACGKSRSRSVTQSK